MPASASKNSNLVQRVATAVVLTPLVVWVMVVGGWPFALLIAVAAALCAHEAASMLLPGDRLLPLLSALWTAALSLSRVWHVHADATILGFGVGSLLVIRMVSGRGLESAHRDVAALVFSGVYGALLSDLIPLRRLGAGEGWTAAGWVLLVCGMTWAADTGAYVAGRTLGRHKLAPRLSPGKTREGLVGGVLAAMGAAWGIDAGCGLGLGPAQALGLGLVAGVVGTLGDLAESMLKRASGVKDSGHILPGHGGMLDRVDAILFNAPLVLAWVRWGMGVTIP